MSTSNSHNAFADILTSAELSSNAFLQNLQRKYPDEVEHTDLSYLSHIYTKLSKADILWRNDTENIKSVMEAKSNNFIGYKVRRFVIEDIKITQESREKQNDEYQSQSSLGQLRIKRSTSSHEEVEDHKHKVHKSIEEEIGRGFHATSIGIVLILLTEVHSSSGSNN